MTNNIAKYVATVELDARKKIEQINQLPVLKREDFETMTEWLKLVVATTKEIKAREKDECAPAKAEIAAIKEKFAKPLDLLATAEKTAREKINVFLVAERQVAEAQAEKDRQARLKNAQKELRKLDRKEATADKYDEATASALKQSIADQRQDIMTKASAQTEINQGGANASVRMVWTFEVVDLAQVPAEFLAVNDTAVRQAIKDGTREIPGLKIYQKPTVAIK